MLIPDDVDANAEGVRWRPGQAYFGNASIFQDIFQPSFHNDGRDDDADD